jgi:hypothetical protein
MLADAPCPSGESARKFPAPARNSLFREKDSLFRQEQGISRRLFKSLCDFASASAKTALNRPNFAKFPVNFPVLRESVRVTDQL